MINTKKYFKILLSGKHFLGDKKMFTGQQYNFYYRKERKALIFNIKNFAFFAYLREIFRNVFCIMLILPLFFIFFGFNFNNFYLFFFLFFLFRFAEIFWQLHSCLIEKVVERRHRLH